MEGHEVPKNISDFEFHLVGDMTLKQFAYLATGLGIAYLSFVFLASPAPFVAWPLIVISALTGTAFAFLPISQRPLDHWAASFFKAIFSPTQRVWASNYTGLDSPQFSNRLNIYLSSLPTDQGVSQTTPKSSVISSFVSTTPPAQSILEQTPINTPSQSSAELKKPILQKSVEQKPTPPAASPQQTVLQPPSLPTNKDLAETVSLAKQAQEIKNKMVAIEKALYEIKVKSVIPGNDPKEFTGEFQRKLDELSTLTNQAREISHRLAILSKTPPTSKERATIKIAPPKQNTIQLVLTTTPNIINGIVTDSLGNYLEGVIVVTHDRQGLPVRALKTNKLGQFLAATPLPNGMYNIVLEKDDLIFDELEIKLDGQVIPPIRVSAKKGEQLITN